MSGWYVVVRTGGTPPDEWVTLSSVMFDEVDEARAFAEKLDSATVYRLEEVALS